MSRDSISKRVYFRWICPLWTIMAYAILSLSPIGAAAQVAGDIPVYVPGLHDELELQRADQPTIHYAIQIPPNYSPSTPVPLILALHYGVRGRGAAGAGAEMVQILIGPALAGFGARRLEQPRKRKGSERVAGDGPGPLSDRQEQGCRHRLQHGRYRLLAY